MPDCLAVKTVVSRVSTLSVTSCADVQKHGRTVIKAVRIKYLMSKFILQIYRILLSGVSDYCTELLGGGLW